MVSSSLVLGAELKSNREILFEDVALMYFTLCSVGRQVVDISADS